MLKLIAPTQRFASWTTKPTFVKLAFDADSRIERSYQRSESWEVSAAGEVLKIRYGTVDMNEFYNINNDIEYNK